MVAVPGFGDADEADGEGPFVCVFGDVFALVGFSRVGEVFVGGELPVAAKVVPSPGSAARPGEVVVG